MGENHGRRKYSDESRERMRVAALARYDANAEQTHKRVRAVMKAIQEEMAANEGIYPFSKGAVSLAEVARRAEIHPNTFHKPRYVELSNEVKDWITNLKKGSIVGRMRVRKELGTRIQEWKKLYDDLKESHRISEVELALATEKLNKALSENQSLRMRIAEQTKLKVVSIHKKTN